MGKQGEKMREEEGAEEKGLEERKGGEGRVEERESDAREEPVTEMGKLFVRRRGREGSFSTVCSLLPFLCHCSPLWLSGQSGFRSLKPCFTCSS